MVKGEQVLTSLGTRRAVAAPTPWGACKTGGAAAPGPWVSRLQNLTGFQ